MRSNKQWQAILFGKRPEQAFRDDMPSVSIYLYVPYVEFQKLSASPKLTSKSDDQ
jgi:hypothetical protein